MRGDSGKLGEAKDREQKARLLKEQLQNRHQMSTHLVKLQQEMEKGANPEELKKKITSIMNQINEEEFINYD